MIYVGSRVPVGDVRRELSALGDDALVEVCAEDAYGDREEPVAIDLWAHGGPGVAGRAGVTLTIRTAFERRNPEPPSGNAFASAWNEYELAGECPLARLSELLRRRLCRCPSDCRAWVRGAGCGAGWPEALGVPERR